MDALAHALGAERMIAPGAGNFVAAAAGFADDLDSFLASVSERKPSRVSLHMKTIHAR